MESIVAVLKCTLTLPRINDGRTKNNKNKIMREKLLLICYEIEDGLDAVAGFNKILSLLGESTEGVSSAESESSDLYDVRECNASGEQIPNEALVEGALEKITEDKNTDFRRCIACNNRLRGHGYALLFCKQCWEICM